ncbi:MAG: hypothetical protein H6619_05130, partial [Deltaproteobacteria bacterium]|nr:hypothetical protein [Deltaproteobacteria bacterium]
MKQSLLLCLFVLCTIWQTQASAQSSPSGTISTINAVPCTLPCNCKWRITFWDKPSEKINVSQGPFNQHIQRSQDVTNGVPYLNLYCCDNTVGAATLAGAESDGTFV